ncbi:hypothetical protein NX059_011215 [Plenodomus lindquistii]|nr:hypothetical protein NX059_011215 [Plenodomus lindquistii]
MASSSTPKDAVPPRRPSAAAAAAATGTTTAGARRATASSTSSPRTSTGTAGASRPPTATSTRTRTSTLGGASLNKPPTRPAPGTAARRTALASKTTSDAEPDLASLTSGDETRKPAVRRTPASATTTAAAAPRASPGKTFSRQALAPAATTPAAKRPLSSTTTRSAPRASLAASSRPTTRAAPSPAPNPAPKTPTGPAKKLSATRAAASPATPETLRDKAASDAEVEMRKTALAPVKAALAKLGEEAPRPDTAPSGPAEMDVEMKRRSAQIMHDFFKETNLRDKLQEQCDDLNREVDKLQSDKARLKKQLLDAQAAIAEKDHALAGASGSAGTHDSAHDALVHDMETKFAHETKQLEEQSQKLELEKEAAQEKSALEAARAGELQQVLDDLNSELEQQGREWDAEKKILAEQATQIEDLLQHTTTLKDERDALVAELSASKDTLEAMQTKFDGIASRNSEDIETRDTEIKSLKLLVQELQSEIATSHKEHNDALAHVQRSLESKSSENSAVVESLQAQIETLHHQHTQELRVKDEAIALHVETEKGLYDDIKTLQQRANQVTAILESERNAHAEEMEKQLEELQRLSNDELRIREEEVSQHLESIDGLQEQIRTLEQGSTDGARVAEELHKQIEELRSSHEAAIKVKTDENEELVQQLDAMNDQLSADAAEVEQLKQEVTGLRTTLETFEKTSQQAESQHASALAKVHAELNDAVKKADAYKLELDAIQDRHRQNLRVLSEDHEGEIESLRADLEGDARERLTKLQAEVDSLKSEKTTTTKQHEEALDARHSELEALKNEIAALKETSGSSSQQADELRAKCKQVEDDKTALMESHTRAQKEIEDLHLQLEALTNQATAAGDLLVRLEALSEEKAAAESAHLESKNVITDLQARHDTLLAEKTAAEDSHHRALETLKQESESALRQQLEELMSKYEALVEEKTAADELHAQEMTTVKEASENAIKEQLHDLQEKYDDLMGEKSANDAAHVRALEALKEESSNASTLLLSELQGKYDSLQREFDRVSQSLTDLNAKHSALSAEKTSIESARKEELERLQEERDAYSNQLKELEKAYTESLTTQANLQECHTKELATLQADIERNYANLLEVLQQDATRLEEEKASALQELSSMKRDMQTRLDDMSAKVESKDRSESAALAEAATKYETLCAQKATADREHENAITLLKDSLEELHKEALTKLQAENDVLQRRSAAMEREHADAIELLKEELKAGHSNEVKLLRQQLETIQTQLSALTEEKAATEEAHENAISELMIGMQASTSDAVEQLQKKHDALVAQLEATQDSHKVDIQAARKEVADQQMQYRDLLSRNDKATAEAEAHAQEVLRLMNLLQDIQSERDQAVQAAEEAEDRIETMKGEVVRKHLARVEPLEKENAMLLDKVDRLEAIIAAGDRVARAAATIGEKRNIDTLAEEDEVEDEEDTTSDGPGQGHNTAPVDVIGTLAAMQETLNQLSELNNDAIAESSRTAQRLTEQH